MAADCVSIVVRILVVYLYLLCHWKVVNKGGQFRLGFIVSLVLLKVDEVALSDDLWLP